MSKQNSKVLKVYEQCETVLKLKRKFVQQIEIPNLPSIQASKQLPILKDYCTAYYLRIAVAKFFREVGQSYSVYKNLISSKKAIQSEIQISIKKIKNTKELTSKHQQLQNQLDQLKKKWEKQDPLVYYDINERTKFKNMYSQKFNEFKDSQTGIKTIKNPHFVHQLINQLKQNLQKISEEDKRYDMESQQSTQRISKYLRDLTKQMETTIDDIEIRNFVFQQQKKLFSQFVDINQGSNSKGFRGSRNSNVVRHYFEQLILISKDIKQHIKRTAQFVDGLIAFFKHVQFILKQQGKAFEKKYQNFIDQVFKNKQIRVILRIDVQQKIKNNLKAIFSTSQIIKTLPDLLYDYKNSLIQTYQEANSYHDKYISKELKYKQTTDSFQKMLMEHKGYFSSLQKKQQKWNRVNIQTLRKFARDLNQMMKMIYQQNTRQSRLKTEVNVHDILNKIFAEYSFNEEKKQLGDSNSTSTDNKDLGLQAKIKDYQKFIDSIDIFDFNNANWSNSYFACSLGPKLLLHGYLQTLEEGIYYESSFNKKNYFFGKTRIFIPKTDIYQVNKQIALLIFPDVIQIKANKGAIYFHALGKRDKMYDQFINIYFPEVLESQNGLDGQLEYQFNQFKGQCVTDRTAFKLKPHAVDLGQATLKNGDLRVIFRRYWSDDSFTYQGKQHQNFKTYQLEHVGGLNPTSNQITPPPPYYFMKKGEQTSDTVPQFSLRLATFEKKVPLIPFVSKGGNAICQQTIKYYWGSPEFLVIQIESIMKGFKFTQGMMIRIQSVYRQDKEKNQVRCSSSCDITFEKEGALTGTIKNEALFQLKQVMRKTIEAIQKNQKNRSIYKNKGNNLLQQDSQKDDYKDQIQKLKCQNSKLNKKFKITLILFVVFYILTIFIMKIGGGEYSNPKESKDSGYFFSKEDKIYQEEEKNSGFWSFL